MLNPRRVSPSIVLTMVVLAIAGCGAPQLAPFGSSADAAHERNSRDAKSASYVYTCQSLSSVDCLVYQKNKIILTLTKGLKKQEPLGVVAGKDGLFYVADKMGQDILVYSLGATKLVATLDDGSNLPVDVAVYNDEVAASNQTTLTFFAKDAAKPTATLKDARAMQGTGAAFDGSGNCYWSFVSKKSGARVDEFKDCKGKGRDLKIAAGSPYGIAFDGSDNLYYTSYLSAANGVYKCNGTKSCALAYSQFIEPQYLNFSSAFTDLWVSDAGNYQSPAVLYEFDASTGKQIDMITAGISFFNPPTGVAPGPGSL